MDRFTRLEKLGKGSFGDVWLIERKNDKKRFALKRIKLLNEELPAKNTANDTLLESLEHPNIIKCNEIFAENKKLCIVMEYADNGDLQKRAQEAKKNGIFLPEPLIWNWFSQLCLALKYLNDKKILHRDIKLQNTFLTKAGMIKLGDFGISKKLENTDEFASTSLGTPYYLSPEMCTSSTYNHKSDMWMLGCLLHELCSLEKPFSGDSLQGVINKIVHDNYSKIPGHYSKMIHQLVCSLLDKEPEKRPSITSLLQIPEILEQFATKKKIKVLQKMFPEVYEKCNNPQEIENQIKITKSKSFDNNSTNFEQYKFHLESEYKPLKPNNGKSDNILKNQSYESEKCHKADTQLIISPKENTKPPLRDTNSFKKAKHHQNSLQYILKQKAKQNISPSNNPEAPLSNSIFNPLLAKDSKPTYEIGPIHSTRERNSIEPVTSTNQQKGVLSNEVQGELQLNQVLKQSSEYNKKLSYQRDMTINTALEPMYANSNLNKSNKQDMSSDKSPNSEGNEKSPHSVPTTKVTQKNFLFSDQIFNPKSPASPHRSLMFGHFIKDRIGEEKFEKLKQLFANHTDPMKLLEDEKKVVIDVIGEEHKECLVFLKYMISSTLTPKMNENKTNVFDQVKSPISMKSPTLNHRNLFSTTPSNNNNQTNSSSQISFSNPKMKPLEQEQEKSNP